jgi:formylglycine-generating enzyme required for sulfatase activity
MQKDMLVKTMAVGVLMVLTSAGNLFAQNSVPVNLTPGDKANMVWVLPGTFTMGSPTNEALRDPAEVQHTVTLTSGFYVGKYEVTQNEYLAVMGNNPSASRFATNSGSRPVEEVTWSNATNYCGKLTHQEQTAGRIQSGWMYRLPTEAEWEYSCRAGTTTAFSFGNAIRGGMADFNDHYEYDATNGITYISNPTVPPVGTTNVGSYAPNAFGLYDMHGNVWEWCQDWFGNYPANSVIDPQGPTSGAQRVMRGGADYTDGHYCRSAEHYAEYPPHTFDYLGFRIVLAPTVPQWTTAITNTPSQRTYGTPPVKQSGKDSLVVVTHGWQLYPLPYDVSFVEVMTNAIGQYLMNNGLSNWQVHAYEWVPNAWKIDPDDALNNAKQEGLKLGNCISTQGWSHIHLIGHSAGAGLIQTAAEIAKTNSPSTIVQCTFLDMYLGSDYAGRTNYGKLTDWSDSYYTRDLETGSKTEGSLSNAYNVDVTQLDTNKDPVLYWSSDISLGHCSITESSHGWPIDFYMNSITRNVTGDYGDFGFPFSVEGGFFGVAETTYYPGNNPAWSLGNPDPPCSQLTSTRVIGWFSIAKNAIVDYLVVPVVQSVTGTIQKWLGSIGLGTDSPAWIAAVVTSTNAMNSVTFDAEFTSTNGAQGLLSVFWDTNTIGWVDETAVQAGFQHYTFRFPNATANSTHVLGFRLDPFTNNQSSILVTNIITGQVGPSQPFSLGITTNKLNGLLVLQLTGQSNFEYAVQASPDLISWTNIAVLANTNGAVGFLDAGSMNYNQRFYRALVLQ